MIKRIEDAGVVEVSADTTGGELFAALGGTGLELFHWNFARTFAEIVASPLPSEAPLIERCIGLKLKSAHGDWLAPLTPRRSAGPDLAAAVWGAPAARQAVVSVFLGVAQTQVTQVLHCAFAAWTAAKNVCTALLIRGLPLEMSLLSSSGGSYQLQLKLFGPSRVIDTWSNWLQPWLQERGGVASTFPPIGEFSSGEALVELAALEPPRQGSLLVAWRRHGVAQVQLSS